MGVSWVWRWQGSGDEASLWWLWVGTKSQGTTSANDPCSGITSPRENFSICVMFVCLHPFASSNCTTTVHTALRACWHLVFTSLKSMGQLLLWPSSSLWSSFFRSKALFKTVVSLLNALWGNSLFYMKVEEHGNIATEKRYSFRLDHFHEHMKKHLH